MLRVKLVLFVVPLILTVLLACQPKLQLPYSVTLSNLSFPDPKQLKSGVLSEILEAFKGVIRLTDVDILTVKFNISVLLRFPKLSWAKMVAV